MWISKQVYLEQRDRAVKAEAIVESVRIHNAALHTTMDWMRLRLNQLEHERAQLIHNYMGVSLAVPNIEPTSNSDNPADIMNQVPSYEDVGDKEALRMGIGWDNDGHFVAKVN
jgi:hypothetical protein